jgi:uncharacterized membrane protein YvbJ
MFCPQCGEKNPDNGKFCSSCGTALTKAAAVAEAPAPRATAETRTSGMAVAALVLGILGISILAIIFGAIGISQTGKDPNLKGKGMAVAGLVLGILGMIGVFIWIIAVIFWSTGYWWVF